MEHLPSSQLERLPSSQLERLPSSETEHLSSSYLRPLPSSEQKFQPAQMRHAERQRTHFGKNVHYITRSIDSFKIQCSAVDTVSRLPAGRSGYRISAGENDSS